MPPLFTMPNFSNISQQRLESCHQDLQILFGYVVQYYDCSIISGHRTPQEQYELYKKGRKQVNGIWTIEDRWQVVTYKDGINKLSKHNTYPSIAVDVMPYPINWSDTEGIKHFAGIVKGVARTLLSYGQIEHEIEWGGDWKWEDMPHYQLKNVKL